MSFREKAGRLGKFIFYLGLGGWTALVNACYESADGRKRDAGASAPDDAGSQTPENTLHRDAAVDTGILGDATVIDAAPDGSPINRPFRSDASAQVLDSGDDDAMWDLPCE